MIEDRYMGLILAIISSFFIGGSFVITKKGLIDSRRNAGFLHTGTERSTDNYTYLASGKWWLGMSLMILGELANFSAYSFASAVLVTPLGALSVLISAMLASAFLHERLTVAAKLGCSLCIVGALIIILHAPEEKPIGSINELMNYVVQPGFVLYLSFVLLSVSYFVVQLVPKYGRRNPLVYIGICSLVGSVSVMACKGVGITLKLTLSGHNQMRSPATYVIMGVAAVGLLTQMVYFNKALDRYSTSTVTPIYYVLFTTATITASAILFQGFYNTNAKDMISLFAGFLTIFFGVFLLNTDAEAPSVALAVSGDGHLAGVNEGSGQLARQESIRSLDYGTDLRLCRPAGLGLWTSPFAMSPETQVGLLAEDRTEGKRCEAVSRNTGDLRSNSTTLDSPRIPTRERTSTPSQSHWNSTSNSHYSQSSPTKGSRDNGPNDLDRPDSIRSTGRDEYDRDSQREKMTPASKLLESNALTKLSEGQSPEFTSQGFGARGLTPSDSTFSPN